MPGFASTDACRGMCLIFTIWLLATQGCASTNDAREACVEFDNQHKEKLLTDKPGDVYLTINRRNLTKEYNALTESLFHARKGTMGAFKSSNLYRNMHVGGHEKAFDAKEVSVYLTKSAQTVGSKIQLCLVDRTNEPEYMPNNIYTEGRTLEFEIGQGCKTHGCGTLGRLKDGVYGVVFDNFDTPPSDKLDLPIDLLKLLEEKDALLVNADMAAVIGTSTKSGFAAAQTVAQFKKQFLAKGINIFYAQKNYSYACGNFFNKGKMCNEWHHWFEYVDIDVAGADYKPTVDRVDVEYPAKFLDLYDQCKNGDTRELVEHIALDVGQTEGETCSENVAGATKRKRSPKSNPTCKCKITNHQVYCGDSLVAGRKFNMNSVMSRKDCKGRKPYCDSRGCYVSTGDRP